EVAVQRGPAVPNAPQSSPSTARSRSASGSTITGFLPPISSETRLSVRPAVWAIWRPTSVEPVNDTRSTPACATSADPASSAPWTTFSTPAGSPASSSAPANASPLAGDSSAGFQTTVFPQTSAGRIFQLGTATGKFQAVITPATPTGRRTVMPNLLGSSLGAVRPKSLRPSVAA